MDTQAPTTRRRAPVPLPARFADAWSDFLASDPGALRLRSACRTTLAVALASLALVPLVATHEAPILAPAVGITFALMASSLPREPRPRDRLVTLVAMAATAALGCLAGALLAHPPWLGQAGFLALLFGAAAFQIRGPRAIAVGFAAVVNVYLVLFLGADLAHLPAALLALPVAFAVTALTWFVLVPERPVAAAARIVRAVERQGAIVVRDCEDYARTQRPGARLRLRRHFATLNESILAAEDQLAAVDPAAAGPVSALLMRFELALVTLSAAVTAAGALDEGERARLRLAAGRLVAGQRSALRPRDGATTPVLTALAELDEAAVRLAEGSDAALRAIAEAPARGTPGPRPPLGWRPATRAVTAAFLAMLGGQLLSPDRWFWAVITVYVVFLGARSSGDMIHRGLLRVWGTVLGLVAGVVVATALAGHPALETAGILACVFGLAYVFAISQTLAVFCVTVLLGLVYSLVGVRADLILLLRLEETAIGAAAAVLVDRFVFRRPTRHHVDATGGQLLGALAEVMRLSARRLAGDPAAAPGPTMRGADRLMRDLRLALRPLQASRALTWWARRPSELPAILTLMFWARVLATASEAAPPPGPALIDRVEGLAARLDALAAPDGRPAGSGRGDDPVEIGAAHLGQSSAELVGTVVANLEGVLDVLAARFGRDGWSALVARRPL